MFFFFASIAPEVRQVLQKNAVNCFNCASKADLVEYDHVLRAFSIPVWRWPAKGTGISCTGCGLLVPSEQGKSRMNPPHPPSELLEETYHRKIICSSCHSTLSEKFKYCPYCGSQAK